MAARKTFDQSLIPSAIFAHSALPAFAAKGSQILWTNSSWDSVPVDIRRTILVSEKITQGVANGSLITFSIGRDASFKASVQPLGAGMGTQAVFVLLLHPAAELKDATQQVLVRTPTGQPGGDLNPISKCSLKSPFEQRLEALGPASQRLLSYDWGKTFLGQLSTWPSGLQVATFTALSSCNASAIYIGVEDDTIVISNDAYSGLLPGIDVFGTQAGTEGGFGEQWTAIVALHRRCQATGQAFAVEEQEWHFPDYLGRLTHQFFRYEWLPIYDEEGHYLCSFTNAEDITEKVLTRQNLEAISAVSAATADTRTVEAFCAAFMDSLGLHTRYIPFAFLYTTNESATGMPSVIAGSSNALCLKLRASYNIEEDDELVPQLVQLRPASVSTSSEDPSLLLSDDIVDCHDLPWQMEKVMREKTMVVLENLETATERFEEAGRTGRAVVYPISAHNQAVEGVLVFGLHMMRPFEGAYAKWTQILAANVNAGIARVAAIEQNELQTSRVQEAERIKSAFFSTIGDELKTPISLILAPLGDLLEREDLDITTRRSIRMASRNALRLMNLFNTLLDYFRSEAGQWIPIFKPVQLDLLTSEVVHQLMSAMRGTAAGITAHCQPVSIYVDPDIYEKLLLLLIGALLRGLRRRRDHLVNVALLPTPDGAILSVSSSTSKAADGHAKFQHSETLLAKRTGSEQGGTESDLSSFDRLGLARELLLKFVTMLHGTLKESQSDGEMHFSVTFETRNRSSLVNERVVEENQRPQTTQTRYAYAAAVVSDDSTPSDGSDKSTISDTVTSRFPEIDAMFGDGPASVRNCTVLVADGNDEMRAFCRDALSSMFNVLEANKAQTALSLIASNTQIDCFVCDAALPGMDAWAFISALRDMEKELPTIVLSTQAGGEARADSLMAGASEMLAKPFSAREILVKACSQVQISKLRTDLESRLHSKTSALTMSEMRADDLGLELQVIANASPVGFYTMDSSGTVVYANEQWHAITGVPRDASYDSWWDYVEADGLPRARSAFQDAVLSAKSCTVAATFLNGKVSLVSIRPWRSSDLSLKFVGSVVDMTEVSRLEAAHLQASKDRAAEAERMRQLQEISVDIFSHELRNPLSAIMQGAELLSEELERIASMADHCIEKKDISEEAHQSIIDKLLVSDETLDAIKSCSMHQRRIADDILNFSKLNMQLLSLDVKPFDLISLISQTIKMFDAEMRKRSAVMKMTIDDTLKDHRGQYIFADFHRLNQVLINFLVNASKYSAEAEKRDIDITVSATASLPAQRPGIFRVSPPDGPLDANADPVWVTVAVKDYGRGLSMAQQQRLFERFSQARPNSDGLIGSGLGLYISRSIVHLHGGFVEICSVEGQFTIFSFTIPVERACELSIEHIVPLQNAQEATALTRRREAEHTKKRPHHRRGRSSKSATNTILASEAQTDKPESAPSERLVLVVDDSSINVKLLQKQLEKKKFSVKTGCNGQEALDAIEKYRSRCMGICLDVEMPVMDGKTAAAELRRREKAQGLAPMPIIGVTGNARQQQIDECLAAGYTYVLTKPYKVDDIERLLLQHSSTV